MFDKQEEWLTDEEEEAHRAENYLDIIVFELDGEKYATHLNDVEQIVEPSPLKSVPHTTPEFKGVFNLRGMIICAIDLRLGEEPKPTKSYLVARTQRDVIALLVDRIVEVKTIEKKDIIADVQLRRVIEREYITGFLQKNSEIISIIKLSQILSEKEFNRISQVLESSQ